MYPDEAITTKSCESVILKINKSSVSDCLSNKWHVFSYLCFGFTLLM